MLFSPSHFYAHFCTAPKNEKTGETPLHPQKH